MAMVGKALLPRICQPISVSLAAVKAALHRGRGRLRELVDAPDDLMPSLAASMLATSTRFATCYPRKCGSIW
ncbi:MAG: hypothetical protein WCA85_05995 [Paraburkholderia sp.]|uniref:hypothetical protein n=1 Tax=Paraburkholderia sp. TaxID=1926495 RepID=UPI003C4B5BCF